MYQPISSGKISLALVCLFVSVTIAAGQPRRSQPAQSKATPAPGPQSKTATASPQPGASKLYFCTSRQILDSAKRKFKEFWSDAFEADAQQEDISEAWNRYLVTTYHLDPNDYLHLPNGGCGETTEAFMRNWKKGVMQQYEQVTKIEQQRVAAGSKGPVEEHTVVDTGWKYTGGRILHPVSQMPAEIRQLIEEDVVKGVKYYCQAGVLNSVYPGLTSFDCTCFGQKLREYRQKDYEQRGDRVVGNAPSRKVLSPQLNGMRLSELNFQSCTTSQPKP